MDPAVSLQVTVTIRNLQVTVQRHQALLAPHVTPPTATGSSHQVPINRVITSRQATDQALTRRVTANRQVTGSRSQVTVDRQCTQRLSLTANDPSGTTKTSVHTATKGYSNKRFKRPATVRQLQCLTEV